MQVHWQEEVTESDNEVKFRLVPELADAADSNFWLTDRLRMDAAAGLEPAVRSRISSGGVTSWQLCRPAPG